MCDNCLKKAMDVNPKLIKLMGEIENDYRALEAKLSDGIRLINAVEIVDEQDQPAEIDPKYAAQFEAEQRKMFNSMGVAAALGWFTALNCDSMEETQVHAHGIFQMLQQKLNEADDYRYLFKMRRH